MTRSFSRINTSLILFFVAILLVGCQQAPKKSTDVTVTGVLTEDTQWNADTTYVIDQQVTVASGVTLNIEAGTVIKALPGEAPQVSMLVVAKGGKINAKGTEENPIIFTSINDNIDPINGVDSALNKDDMGLWGGIIILGDAPVSLPNKERTTFYLGLDPNAAESYYGGDNADDNSGIMEYVSIRHGGIFIGTGNESNGLTLCGVGAQTIINHIEIFANQDDGVEFFGGTVNVNNIIVHGSGDDGIDIDEGYTGTISNFLIELEADSDNALEISGGKGNFTGEFSLNNGILDGTNATEQRIYSIDESAVGSISNIIEVNVSDNAKRQNGSKNVTINTKESSEELNSLFSWSKAKS